MKVFWLVVGVTFPRTITPEPVYPIFLTEILKLGMERTSCLGWERKRKKKRMGDGERKETKERKIGKRRIRGEVNYNFLFLIVILKLGMGRLRLIRVEAGWRRDGTNLSKTLGLGKEKEKEKDGDGEMEIEELWKKGNGRGTKELEGMVWKWDDKQRGPVCIAHSGPQ